MAREVINRPGKRGTKIKRTITPQTAVSFVGQLIKAHLEYNPQSRVTWRRNTFMSLLQRLCSSASEPINTSKTQGMV